MKYYFAIGGFAFSNVSNIKITKVYRAESTIENLSGGILKDRAGNKKTNISVTFGGLTAEEMKKLDECYDGYSSLLTTVSFYEDESGTNEPSKYTMTLESFTKPAPIYYYGDRKKGLIYPKMTVKFTEV